MTEKYITINEYVRYWEKEIVPAIGDTPDVDVGISVKDRPKLKSNHYPMIGSVKSKLMNIFQGLGKDEHSINNLLRINECLKSDSYYSLFLISDEVIDAYKRLGIKLNQALEKYDEVF